LFVSDTTKFVNSNAST